MLLINVEKTTTQKYRATRADTGEELAVSKTPFLCAARKLQDQGLDADMELGMTWGNGVVTLSGKLAKLAGRTIHENETRGPVFGKYRSMGELYA